MNFMKSFQFKTTQNTIDVELMDTNGDAFAMYYDELGQMIGCSFNIFDNLHPKEDGTKIFYSYLTGNYEEVQTQVNPYSRGLEYLQDDIIEFLTSNEAKWHNIEE